MNIIDGKAVSKKVKEDVKNNNKMYRTIFFI